MDRSEVAVDIVYKAERDAKIFVHGPVRVLLQGELGWTGKVEGGVKGRSSLYHETAGWYREIKRYGSRAATGLPSPVPIRSVEGLFLYNADPGRATDAVWKICEY